MKVLLHFGIFRHSRNKERIEENIDSWRSKITRNEGIRKGMSTILDWLTEEEKRVALPRQLPLSIEKLADLVIFDFYVLSLSLFQFCNCSFIFSIVYSVYGIAFLKNVSVLHYF